MEHYVLAALLTCTTMQTRDDAPQDKIEPQTVVIIEQESAEITGEPTKR